MSVNRYQVLHALIDELELFEQQKGKSYSLEDFISWLTHRIKLPLNEELLETDSNATAIHVSISIITMYRYAKHYIKKALEPTLLSTPDDFTFLADLSDKDSIQKTALIQDHLLEITSGMEILKRLEKHQLIESFQDPEDKRSKRVRITPEGRKTLYGIMTEMSQVAQIISGNLPLERLEQLLAMLKELEHFHNHIYQNDRKSSIQHIFDQYFVE